MTPAGNNGRAKTVYTRVTHRLPLAILAASALFAADLPVKEVVLYKNGIGYFTRTGQVTSNASVHIGFKRAEMNDVLKSLTIRDASGAPVSGARYTSGESPAQKLAEFPFTAADENPSLSGFLHSMQGSRVALQTGEQRVEGTIMLARKTPPAGNQPETEHVVLLLDDGTIRTIQISSATSIQFADAVVQNRLKEYFRMLAGARSDENRSITIQTGPGNAARTIHASYMVPAPIWKSSYRLVFAKGGRVRTDADRSDASRNNNDAKLHPESAATLEAWAIVDNTSGEDWRNVQLSLVSGRPVSFVSNLYEPRHVERAAADLPELASVMPELYEGAMQARASRPQGIAGGVPGGLAGGVIGGVIGGVPSAAPPAPPPSQVAESSPIRQQRQPHESTLAIRTEGREFLDLFEYRFSEPVTIHSGESAMIPFLQQKVPARKLLIYSNRSDPHPRSAVELMNNTGKTLDGGPITVSEQDSYAGEALMSTLKSGDRRLISYAVDLGTRVGSTEDSRIEDVHEAHAARGILTTLRSLQHTVTYTVHNADSRPKTLIVEHPIVENVRLLSPRAAETTPSQYRFEVKLAPSSTESLQVITQRVHQEELSISSFTPDSAAVYFRNKRLPESARRQLEQLAQMKTKENTLNNEIDLISTELRILQQDQERIRQNIASLMRVPGQEEQVQRYARTLSDQESRIATLRGNESDRRAARGELQASIGAFVEAIEF